MQKPKKRINKYLSRGSSGLTEKPLQVYFSKEKKSDYRTTFKKIVDKNGQVA